MAYLFYLGNTLLPVSPAKLNTTIKNQNKTIDLINLNEVNILKAPGLTEIKFDALLPNVEYPFATYKGGFQPAKSYLDILETLKVSKKPFQFIVSRSMPTGAVLSYTNMKVSLESYEIKESSNDGFDVPVSIVLKQYRDYGAKTAKVKQTKVVKTPSRESKEPDKKYTVKKGDTLSGIAKKEYDNSQMWKQIYANNTTNIERVAQIKGLPSSSNGWWIFEGTLLALPPKQYLSPLSKNVVYNNKNNGGSGGSHSF